MKLSNKTRLFFSISYSLIYFLILYLFTSGVFSIAYKNVFTYSYIGLGFLLVVLYHIFNREGSVKDSRRVWLVMLLLAIWLIMMKSF